MAVWSSLNRALQGSKILNSVVLNHLRPKNGSLVRAMSDHGPEKFRMQPSRWQWHKFKDLFHFYACVAVIPMGLLSLYCNTFIGPAQLAPIPEGYEPAEWEYYEHPITRFLVKYVYTTPQQEYEKYCHYLAEEQDKMELRKLEAQVRALMSDRADYQAWYYQPVETKYHRQAQRDEEETLIEGQVIFNQGAQ